MAAPLSQTELDSLLSWLAREDSFVFLETTKITSEEHLSWLFLKPVAHLRCTAVDSPDGFFVKAQEALEKGYYLAGWMAYEFGHLLEPVLSRTCRLAPQTVLADFGVYPAPHVYDHLTDSFNKVGPWPTAIQPKSQRSNAEYAIGNLRLSESKTRYLDIINRIKAFIEAGDTYQVNYTLKYLFDFVGSPEILYKTLRRGQSVSYGAFIRQGGQHILSFSPELFFRKNGDKCTVRPMKGTMPRGRTVEEDIALADFLHRDQKNRSENIMIVDLLRNDLGRLCQPGKVTTPALFTVENYETVHQMTSTVEGILRPGGSMAEFCRALFPCGSVTGAPKIRTMEIIKELESGTRGIYTGGIGFFTPAGDAVFNVPIRTVVLENGKGEMGIGSGVVYDSDPEKEWEECRIKGDFLVNPVPEFSLIETILWQPNEGYWLLDLHLNRLLRSAVHLGFEVDRDYIIKKINQESEKFGQENSLATGLPAKRVRLTLTKNGEVELSASSCVLPEYTTIPAPKNVAIGTLAKVCLAGKQVDSRSVYFFHKTTIRNLFEEEWQKAADRGCFEVLFENEKGEITEGSFTNIFVKKGNVLHTPPVSCGLLAGVLREYLKITFPAQIRETVLTRQDLEEATTLYVGNSVRGLVEVQFETAQVGRLKADDF